ncbi:tryptophan--tRNA ligase [Halobacteriales archaeon SW_7_68_16]|nr:MAG: tryptophan--tRNA ligase [Halobacteriales archaeon SW_7_68_16]
MRYEPTDDTEYDRVIEAFGATPIDDATAARFPDHPLVRRRVFYAGRDVDRFLDAATTGSAHAVVTGVGPSGPMHLGHVAPIYFARRVQEATGAFVCLPLSDDEKRFDREMEFTDTSAALRSNLRDLLAVGFDPERTRIVIDTADADLVYPIAADLAADLTPATVRATYGEPSNAGLGFYPAVQATHLLLPQLLDEPQPTLVPIAADQDPHVRVCRDLAGKERLPVEKPGALLGQFLPSLDGEKMSSSTGEPIRLTDDEATVRGKLHDAYTGGQRSVAAHRERGGDPTDDVPFQLLAAIFEPDDDRLAAIARDYRAGDLLSGELKELAADRIVSFLDDHQRRRAALGPLAEELAPFRPTDAERRRALDRIGLDSI